MSSPTDILQCEICKNVTAVYRPKLNRILCLVHAKECEAERSIHVFMATSTEQLAADMLHQHQLTFSKKKILEIMKTAANKSLTELESD